MAKIGDRVNTIYGIGSVIFGRRIAIGCDEVYQIKPGVILSIVKTKEEIEIDNFKTSSRIWNYIANKSN